MNLNALSFLCLCLECLHLHSHILVLGVVRKAIYHVVHVFPSIMIPVYYFYKIAIVNFYFSKHQSEVCLLSKHDLLLASIGLLVNAKWWFKFDNLNLFVFALHYSSFCWLPTSCLGCLVANRFLFLEYLIFIHHFENLLLPLNFAPWELPLFFIIIVMRSGIA